MEESKRRRGSTWERLGRGVAIPAGLTGDQRFWATLCAWASVLPDGYAFTGLTAARVHRLWLPPVPKRAPLFVALPEGPSRCRHRQLSITRHVLPPAVLEVDAIRVATVPEALLACARELSLLDVVVLVDSALQLERCTRAEIEGVARPGRRGTPLLRRALGHADRRSESPWETLLRMLHVLCGIPVEPQAVIRDAAGDFVGRADLLITGTRTLQEYDGAVHLERRQYVRDRRRDSRLAREGYVRNGWTSRHVLDDGWSILREAGLALGAPVEPRDLAPWYAALDESLFGLGYATLGQKWLENHG